MSKPVNLIVEADGGSRGNPGPAGSGAVVINADSGEVILEIARFIGVATNNVAEYLALKAGLEGALEINPAARILVRMDSKLVIEQMSGSWKIKHPDMIQLAAEVQKIVQGHEVKFMWIPREENSRADALANKAMDESADSTISAEGEIPRAPVAEFNQTAPSSVRAPGNVTAPLTTVVHLTNGCRQVTKADFIERQEGVEAPGLQRGHFHQHLAGPGEVCYARGDVDRLAEVVALLGQHGPRVDADVRGRQSSSHARRPR